VTRKPALLLLPGLAFLLVGFLLPAVAMLLAPPGEKTSAVLTRFAEMLTDPYELRIIRRTVLLGLIVIMALMPWVASPYALLLMLPFMLGRPLGEPNDAMFQRRVLLQALRLLERDDGPVILEHVAQEFSAHTL